MEFIKDLEEFCENLCRMLPEINNEIRNAGGKLPDAETVRLSLVTVLCVVFLLPRMHERYFYLAVCLAAVMAVRARRFFVPFALLELASLSRLWEMGIPLRAASAMVFAALVLTVLPERRAGTGDNPV